MQTNRDLVKKFLEWFGKESGTVIGDSAIDRYTDYCLAIDVGHSEFLEATIPPLVCTECKAVFQIGSSSTSDWDVQCPECGVWLETDFEEIVYDYVKGKAENQRL